MRKTSFVVVAILISLSMPLPSFAETYNFVIKKQEEKKKNRWSLEEWLETRDRIMLMDLWLAMNSPSPYEFYLSADYQVVKPAGYSGIEGLRLAGAAYASIFGLEFQQEFVNSRWMAFFMFRFFGYHAQAMNLTAEIGLKSENRGFHYRNFASGLRMTIYFMKHFGIEGLGRHYFDSTGGTGVSGDRFEGGAFIDFSFIRVYGTWFYEKQNQDVSNGILLGTKFFF